jgi:hypothetical protein
MNVSTVIRAVILAGSLILVPASAVAAAPGGTAARQAVAMPRYYVTASTGVATVHNSATGAVTGTVRVPGGPSGTTVTVAADERSFIVGTGSGSQYRFFLMRLSSAGVPGKPAQLPGSMPLAAHPMSRTSVTGIALSPDGTKLAVSVEHFAPTVDTFVPFAAIEVIDLATGKVHSWPAARQGWWAGPPSWAGGNTKVAFAWWQVTSPVFPRIAQHVAGIGVLDTSKAAALPGSLMPLSPALGIRSVAFASGSPVGVAVACLSEAVGGSGGGVVIARIGQVRLGSGQVRVLASQTVHYSDATARVTLLQRCGSLVSVDPNGQHVLVYGTGFGRVDGVVFRSLPGLPADGTAAW